MFGMHAHSIASTGHDLNGRLLPLYFQMRPIGDNVWFQPMLVYVTAPVLRSLPLSEWAIRLPTVLAGLTDVMLIYCVGKRIFKRDLPALIAAVFLALAPAHFMTSRLAMDYLYPVPFLLAWFLCLAAFLESGRLWRLFAGTTLLGLGFYSYIAAVVMMPFYLLLTFLALWRERRLSIRACVTALVGFAWPLLPLVFWLMTQPTYADTVGRYAFLHSPREALHFFAITDRINIYWSFLNPSYLFVTGGVDVIDSTRRIGVFLLPMAPLLLVGLNEIANLRRETMNLILVVGFFTAPLAAMIPAEAYAIDRALEVLPFAVLISVWGTERMLSARQQWMRLTAYCALVLIPIQFGVFCVDYLGDYRVRSAGMYGGNLRGAIEKAIVEDSQAQAPAIYLSTAIPYVDPYWTFYVTKMRRQDLLKRTQYFDPAQLEVDTVPDGALMMTLALHLPRLKGVGTVTPIPELNESVAFAVVRR